MSNVKHNKNSFFTLSHWAICMCISLKHSSVCCKWYSTSSSSHIKNYSLVHLTWLWSCLKNLWTFFPSSAVSLLHALTQPSQRQACSLFFFVTTFNSVSSINSIHDILWFEFSVVSLVFIFFSSIILCWACEEKAFSIWKWKCFLFRWWPYLLFITTKGSNYYYIFLLQRVYYIRWCPLFFLSLFSDYPNRPTHNRIVIAKHNNWHVQEIGSLLRELSPSRVELERHSTENRGTRWLHTDLSSGPIECYSTVEKNDGNGSTTCAVRHLLWFELWKEAAVTPHRWYSNRCSSNFASELKRLAPSCHNPHSSNFHFKFAI